MKKNLWKVPVAVFALLTVVCIAAIPITSYFAPMINIALNAETQCIIPDPNAQIFYWTRFDSEEALVANDWNVCRQVMAEGASVLLNRNDALPLAPDSKISCFSQSSIDPVKVGTGSAFVSTGEGASLYSALEDSFQPGCVNTDLWKFYVTSGYKRENAALSGGDPSQYRINEVPWDKFTDALKATFADYGDAALVTLSRSSGEGADLPYGLEELEPYMTGGDYLRLCKEEMDLLQNLKELKKQGTFKKIIVLLNSSSTLQLDFIDEYDIDAVVWTGNLGINGLPAAADILAGKVNPSGRIVDTFLKDNHSSPAMVNYDAYPYTNASQLDLAFAQNNTAPGIEKCNMNYVVYQEGIYVGYRYYETRYEDYVLGQGNAGDYDYSADVAFPFGAGLSYTTFAYSNFTVEDKGEHFEIEVDVTNIGDMDGKHTVQIYVQSPYTDYDRENGIEKAAVELCGFDKREIKAGDMEHFTITVLKEDLTSYDANAAKTYILDAGDYYFTVGTDAHNAINNILAAKGADASRMIGTGDAALTAKWMNDALDTTTYAVSSVTGNPITNLFENADLNKYAGAEDQQVTYLTRNDWTGTFPQSPVSLRVTDAMWNDGLTHEESGRAALVERYKQLYWANVAQAPAAGTGGTLNAIDFVGKDYTDPAWDELISQIAYEDMLNLIYNGSYQTQVLPAINLPATQQFDGPTGFTKSVVGGSNGMAFTSEDVMAATYNRELIQEGGKCMGEDMLHAQAGENAAAVAGIYAPGVNIHRSPYLGRHNEYYSEDGWLSGEICAAQVQGLHDRGMLAFVKHFALNDQEEGRYGISVWANEQAIRELYLESFEGAIRGGASNVMSSFNRLGVVWAGAHHGLMTGILRNEWGMEGSAITDMAINAKWMDYRLGVLAGQDYWCGQKGNMGTLDGTENDPAIATAVHDAVKNVVYSVTRTNAMNMGNATVVKITPWWQVVLYAATAVCAVFTAGSVCMLIRSKKKKENS
jgi:beta-glucosidase